jgi:hypothetical protein
LVPPSPLFEYPAREGAYTRRRLPRAAPTHTNTHTHTHFPLPIPSSTPPSQSLPLPLALNFSLSLLSPPHAVHLKGRFLAIRYRLAWAGSFPIHTHTYILIYIYIYTLIYIYIYTWVLGHPVQARVGRELSCMPTVTKTCRVGTHWSNGHTLVKSAHIGPIGTYWSNR